MRKHGMLSFGVGFSVALFCVMTRVPVVLDHYEISRLETRHSVANFYQWRVQGIQDAPRPAWVHRVAFLGDSMVVSYPPESQVPSRVQQELNRLSRGRTPIRISNIGLPGTSIVDYYFMADVIGEARPDAVVIPINLASTSSIYISAFARPELSGWLRPERLPTALLLPIHWIGLTADRLLMNVGIVQLGGFERWAAFTEEQTRVAEARKAFESTVAHRGPHNKSPEQIFEGRTLFYGLRHDNLDGTHRYTDARMRQQYGASLAGLGPSHPSVVFLAATVRHFESKGIETLVYVTPLNVDHVRFLGLENDAGLAATIRRLEAATVESGGDFIDLHALFGDDMFRDPPGHLVFEGPRQGPRELAAEIAPRLIEITRRGKRATTGRGGR